MPPAREAAEAWHLDKRVPIALVLSLAAQTVGIVWWAASLSGRVEDHSRRIVSLEATDRRVATDQIECVIYALHPVTSKRMYLRQCLSGG